MRIEDEEFALPQFPGIVDAHDAVGVLPAAIHDGTAHLLQVLPNHLALLHDLLPVRDMQDPAIIVGQVLHHPRDLSRPDPLLRIVELVLAAEVDAVNQGLDLGDGQHARQSEVALQGEPGEKGLEGAIGAAPTVVVEGLVAVMIVLIYTFHVVLDVLLFREGADEGMRVEELLRGEGDHPFGGLNAVRQQVHKLLCLLRDAGLQRCAVILVKVDLKQSVYLCAPCDQWSHLNCRESVLEHSHSNFELEGKTRDLPLYPLPMFLLDQTQTALNLILYPDYNLSYIVFPDGLDLLC